MTDLDRLAAMVEACPEAPMSRALQDLIRVAPELIAVARAGRRVSTHVLRGGDPGAHQDHEAALAALDAKLAEVLGA